MLPIAAQQNDLPASVLGIIGDSDGKVLLKFFTLAEEHCENSRFAVRNEFHVVAPIGTNEPQFLFGSFRNFLVAADQFVDFVLGVCQGFLPNLA